MSIRPILFSILLACLGTAQAASPVPAFSRDGLRGWKAEIFKGETDYEITWRTTAPVVRSESHGTASGLIYEAEIDLKQTPELSWSWRVDAPLATPDEQVKEGDDYVSRVFVIAKGGMAFWNTLSINYVWSSNAPVGAHWPSPYTENVHVVVIESGSTHAGEWCSYSRNIRDDFVKYFGIDVATVNAVAIMTDTDDTGSDAVAWYGDISFQ